MLHHWIAPMTVAQFRREHLGTAPFAAPNTGRAVAQVLDWQALDRILARAPQSDVLVVARGELIEVPAPRSLAALARLMAAGIGCTVRRVATLEPGLARLAESFGAELPGVIDLHVFVTPGGSHGFGWHYDTEHVFIVQTAGIKDYYFRANTMVQGTPADAPVDLALYPGERSPVATARLLPGDCLYLPARWWHRAVSAQDSLSLSLGVVPAAAQ